MRGALLYNTAGRSEELRFPSPHGGIDDKQAVHQLTRLQPWSARLRIKFKDLAEPALKLANGTAN